MKKNSKVGCQKLDALEEKQLCLFCQTQAMDEMKFGPVYIHKNIITHYYCLLLSSNMEQNGRDSEGILGFLAPDIEKEARRGIKLYCTYCRKKGATLGCAISRCKVVFHLPCGMERGTLHQFFGEFKSYCNKHRPVQKISEKILAESSKETAACGICYEKVVPRPVHETLWAPCCQKNAFFHRECVQKLALSAGYFFKCPLCNNVDTFISAMKDFGIYIPEQDASWERVPQAYQDLLVRHDTCDDPDCKCPRGRKTNVQGTRWELILCKFCGSQGIHIGCGRLKWKSPEYECEACTETPADSQEGNRSSNGDRHRLSAVGRAAQLHPSVSADRDDSDTDSSTDSRHLITNRRQRVVSPPSEPREKSPTRHQPKLNHDRHKHRHRRGKRKKPERKNHSIPEEDSETKELQKSPSRSILVDDSDEDIEVISILSGKGTGCLKTNDGSTIQVVSVSNVQKRPRVEGDVQVLPDEIYDMTNFHLPKKPRIPTPLRVPSPPSMIKEVVYSLPSPPPQPIPSTTFTTNSSFVLLDPTTMRQQGFPSGTVVYRSLQPIMNLPQQNQPPMQQLDVSSSHANAKYSDLGEYGAWRIDHSKPKHFQNIYKKVSRTFKCDSFGRRRGRRRNNRDRLNMQPVVQLTPLQFSISSSHVEIICPRRNQIYSSIKKQTPTVPVEKIKTKAIESHEKSKTPSQKHTGKKKMTVVGLSTSYKKSVKTTKKKKEASLSVLLNNHKKLLLTNKKNQSRIETKTPQSLGNIMNQSNSSESSSVSPTLDNYFSRLQVKMPKGHRQKINKHAHICSKFELNNKTKFKPSKKTKRLKLKAFGDWNFKQIDNYLMKIDGKKEEKDNPGSEDRSPKDAEDGKIMVKIFLDEMLRKKLTSQLVPSPIVKSYKPDQCHHEYKVEKALVGVSSTDDIKGETTQDITDEERILIPSKESLEIMREEPSCIDHEPAQTEHVDSIIEDEVKTNKFIEAAPEIKDATKDNIVATDNIAHVEVSEMNVTPPSSNDESMLMNLLPGNYENERSQDSNTVISEHKDVLKSTSSIMKWVPKIKFMPHAPKEKKSITGAELRKLSNCKTGKYTNLGIDNSKEKKTKVRKTKSSPPVVGNKMTLDYYFKRDTQFSETLNNSDCSNNLQISHFEMQTIEQSMKQEPDKIKLKLNRADTKPLSELQMNTIP